MYLSKPEGGFCIPVLYIKKDELNIRQLKNINKELEVEDFDYFRNDFEDKYLKNKRNFQTEEWDFDNLSNEKNNRLTFDMDEPVEGEFIKQSIVDRKISELGAESVGVLILDGEDIEDSNFSDL